MYNGRPSYKHVSAEYYLFFLNQGEGWGDSHWVIEDRLGKTKNDDGVKVYGLVRYDGNDHCPELAGLKWSQVWNRNVVDDNIKINCQSKYFFRCNA